MRVQCIKVKNLCYCLIVLSLSQIRDECLANVRRQLEEKEAELEAKLKKVLAEIGEHTHKTSTNVGESGLKNG